MHHRYPQIRLAQHLQHFRPSPLYLPQHLPIIIILLLELLATPPLIPVLDPPRIYLPSPPHVVQCVSVALQLQVHGGKLRVLVFLDIGETLIVDLLDYLQASECIGVHFHLRKTGRSADDVVAVPAGLDAGVEEVKGRVLLVD